MVGRGEPSLRCARCKCVLPDLSEVDAALRHQVRDLVGDHHGLEAIRVLRGATGWDLRATKSVVTHLVSEVGACLRCRGPLATTDTCECPRCHSLNLSW